MNDAIIQEIKRRARVYAEDNLRFPDSRDYLMIENAMLIGASVVLENGGPDPVPGEESHSQHSLLESWPS
jgi:hypothetical protein